jgi:uncharacterized protein YceK
VRANTPASFGNLALLLTAVACLSGCVTGTTLEAARTYSHVNEKQEVVIDQKGKPGYYALVPLTVPADIVLAPVYLGWWVWCVTTGHID